MKSKNKPKKRTPKPLVKRSVCPRCGHAELLTIEPDQFCLACDWDTCAEYVEQGLMDNISIAGFVHFPPTLGSQSEEMDNESKIETQSLKATA